MELPSGNQDNEINKKNLSPGSRDPYRDCKYNFSFPITDWFVTALLHGKYFCSLFII